MQVKLRRITGVQFEVVKINIKTAEATEGGMIFLPWRTLLELFSALFSAGTGFSLRLILCLKLGLHIHVYKEKLCKAETT